MIIEYCWIHIKKFICNPWHDNLDLINANIDGLFLKGNELKTIVANQTILIRKIIKSDSIKLIDEVRVKFDEYIVNTTRERLITDLIIQAESEIYYLRFQFDELFNAKNIGKVGLPSPQIIDRVLFIENYKRALRHYLYNTALEPKYENYQFILV